MPARFRYFARDGGPPRIEQGDYVSSAFAMFYRLTDRALLFCLGWHDFKRMVNLQELSKEGFSMHRLRPATIETHKARRRNCPRNSIKCRCCVVLNALKKEQT